MTKCFLEGWGNCSGKMSREHYISKNVLNALSTRGGVEVGGLNWQPNKTLQRIGIQALVAKVLCQTHNSQLSELDTTAGNLYKALNAADKDFANLPCMSQFDGLLTEKWFLKVLCGLAASGTINNGEIPESWKAVLNGDPLPEHWGMYLPNLTERQILANEFYVETLVSAATNEVKAALFQLAGVSFWFLLGCPDNPQNWGTYRARGIIFKNEIGEKCIEFVWPHHTEQAVTYTKVGITKDVPSQKMGWKKQT